MAAQSSQVVVLDLVAVEVAQDLAQGEQSQEVLQQVSRLIRVLPYQQWEGTGLQYDQVCHVAMLAVLHSRRPQWAVSSGQPPMHQIEKANYPHRPLTFSAS